MVASQKLRLVRLLHTLAWAFFASCIVATPVAAWHGRFAIAAALIAIVLVEVLVIVGNRGQCPLTPIAARYTTDRSDNFDIYLPAWLARHNQRIFGTLWVAGALYTAVAWITAR